jgi:hypothetical protein
VLSHHLPRGPGLSLSGVGIGVGVWVVEKAGVNLPHWLLIPVGVAAVLMFIGGLLMAYRDRHSYLNPGSDERLREMNEETFADPEPEPSLESVEDAFDEASMALDGVMRPRKRRVGIRNWAGAESQTEESRFGPGLDVGIDNRPGGKSKDKGSTFE